MAKKHKGKKKGGTVRHIKTPDTKDIGMKDAGAYDGGKKFAKKVGSDMPSAHASKKRHDAHIHGFFGTKD